MLHSRSLPAIAFLRQQIADWIVWGGNREWGGGKNNETGTSWVWGNGKWSFTLKWITSKYKSKQLTIRSRVKSGSGSSSSRWRGRKSNAAKLKFAQKHFIVRYKKKEDEEGGMENYGVANLSALPLPRPSIAGKSKKHLRAQRACALLDHFDERSRAGSRQQELLAG